MKRNVSLLKEIPLANRVNLSDDGNLARAILEYLLIHPHAADSVEGVARWWLGERGVASTLPEVELAVSHLVEIRALRKERLADGTTLYSKSGGQATSP